MRITLIGMSGSGKTHWSKELEARGFRRFCCDDMIEEKLRDELVLDGLKGGINDVSEWMGQPYEQRYAQRSRRYLYLEAEMMREIFQHIENDLASDVDVVIDTTGSVIYTAEDIIDKLSTLTIIGYLDSPASVQEKMYDLYLKDPKPVIWGDLFQKKKGESGAKALARCYPKLLEFRTNRHRELADVTLDYYRVRQPDFTVEDLLNIVSRP